MINMDFNLDFEESGFTNDGQLDVNIDVKELTWASRTRRTCGSTSASRPACKGDFSDFQFGLDTDTEIHIYDNLDIFIDWPDPFGTSTIDLFFIDETIDFNNVIAGFHINSNTFGEVFDIPFIVFLHRGMRRSTSTSGRDLASPRRAARSRCRTPPDDGEHTPAWLITPDVTLLGFSLPDFALDIIAWFASPYGHGFDVSAGCEPWI